MAEEVKIVAILQNQWFKDPEGVKAMMEEHPERRERYIEAFLFMGCLTGRRLRSAFGEELCDRIIWEEASPEIGGAANSRFPADARHIAGVILKHRPAVVIALGTIAANGVMAALDHASIQQQAERLELQIITGPHPAARQDPMPRLREIGSTLRAAREEDQPQ